MATPPIDKEKLLLVSKILIFSYIVISPFVDHKKYLAPLDNIFAKGVILILIVLTSFIDFQLAILLTIALFVMIINFNRKELSQLFGGQTKAENIPLTAFRPIMSEQRQPSSEKQVALKLKKDEDIQPYTSETMYNFPDAACNTKPFEDTAISDNLMSYYIDDKVKPYEVYIRMITNGENLQKAQTNLVSQL